MNTFKRYLIKNKIYLLAVLMIFLVGLLGGKYTLSTAYNRASMVYATTVKEKDTGEDVEFSIKRLSGNYYRVTNKATGVSAVTKAKASSEDNSSLTLETSDGNFKLHKIESSGLNASSYQVEYEATDETKYYYEQSYEEVASSYSEDNYISTIINAFNDNEEAQDLTDEERIIIDNDAQNEKEIEESDTSSPPNSGLGEFTQVVNSSEENQSSSQDEEMSLDSGDYSTTSSNSNSEDLSDTSSSENTSESLDSSTTSSNSSSSAEEEESRTEASESTATSTRDSASIRSTTSNTRSSSAEEEESRTEASESTATSPSNSTSTSSTTSSTRSSSAEEEESRTEASESTEISPSSEISESSSDTTTDESASSSVFPSAAIGTWTGDNSGIEMTWTFNSDGTLSISSSGYNGTSHIYKVEALSNNRYRFVDYDSTSGFGFAGVGGTSSPGNYVAWYFGFKITDSGDIIHLVWNDSGEGDVAPAFDVDSPSVNEIESVTFSKQ